MKAWVLHDIGTISYEDVDIPMPGHDEVLVNVKAAGICGSDIGRIYRDGAHVMPLIPGHEFSGIIEKTGKSVDKSLQGKRVGIFPLIPCGKCTACAKGNYEMCHDYSYLGSRRDGGYAEYVTVPKWNVMELPDGVSYEAAAMFEPMAVSVHAMRRIDMSECKTAAVIGLGTIGLLLTMFLADKGVPHIIAIGNKRSQQRIIQEMENENAKYFDGKNQNVTALINDYTDGCGVDVVFECVGNNITIGQAVNITGDGGNVCFVGNPKSDIHFDKNTYWRILRKQIRITGTWNSSYMGCTGNYVDDWRYVMNRIEEGKIHPEWLISHRFDLEGLTKGLEIMRDKSEEYIKIMCVMDGN